MSIRYINSNDLIDDVPNYLQNIINNMDCVYIDGIKPNNQHFNLTEHDVQIRTDERAKTIEEIKEAINEHLFDSPMMNPIMTRNEILLFLEQLKSTK